jgi:hypothetical protein
VLAWSLPKHVTLVEFLFNAILLDHGELTFLLVKRLEINVKYRVLAEQVNIGIGIVGKLFHVKPNVVIVNGF